MPAQLIALAVSNFCNGRTVLDTVGCSLGADDRTGIIGENGSDKSTLLRLFAGSELDEGEIVVHAEGGGCLAQDERLRARLSVQQIIDRSLHELRRIEVRMRWRFRAVPPGRTRTRAGSCMPPLSQPMAGSRPRVCACLSANGC